VVWEELATEQAPRWEVGTWVVVALVEAPPGSPWAKRFAAPGPRWTIGAGGDAYLPNPDLRSVNLLGEFLALAKEQRNARPGIMVLAKMVEKATPQLGASALARLQEIRRLPADGEATGMLMRGALDYRRPVEMRRAILKMAAQGRLPVAGPWLNAFIARRGELEAEAYAAKAQLEGNLSEDDVAMLLDRDAADLRAVGARYARGDLAARRLPELVRSDPAPAVRSAAVLAAVLSRTDWGLAAALPGLADGDAAVRSMATHAIAALGTPAITPLVAEVTGNTPAAVGAITTLSLMGDPGRAALRDIAQNNREERLRQLALSALGEVKETNTASERSD
jgi:hypothetical protein